MKRESKRMDQEAKMMYQESKPPQKGTKIGIKTTRTVCIALSLFLMLTILLFAPPAATVSDALEIAAAHADVGDYITPDYNTPNDISWSLTTLEGNTINRNSFPGKTLVMVFYRGNGLCSMSNNSIRLLSQCDWIKNEDIVVIAVEADEATRETVVGFKNQYTPGCDDIIFTYGNNGRYAMWDYVRKLLNTNRITFSVNVIIDAEDNIRYIWDANYNAEYYQAHVATLVPSIAMPNISSVVPYTFDIQGTCDYDEAYAVLAGLNELRRSLGLTELIMDGPLLASAMQRAAEIAIYYDHNRPDGQNCFTAFPPGYTILGENIAIGQVNAASVMTDWENSRGHYLNMTSERFERAGIGCFYQEDGTKSWVQLFSKTATQPASKQGKVMETKTIQAFGEFLSLRLQPNTVTIPVEGNSQMDLYNTRNEGYPYAGNMRILPSFYECDNSTVASVSANGIVTGTGAGSTVVRLGVGSDLYEEASVSVFATPISRNLFTVDTTAETYSGSAIVKSVHSGLIEGQDYIVVFENNTNAGTATVNITGIGKYSETVLYNFAIRKAPSSLTAADITLDLTDSGRYTAISPVFSGQGAVYSYASSNPAVITVDNRGQVTANSVGAAIITISAVSENYETSSCTIQVVVTAKPKQSMQWLSTSSEAVYGEDVIVGNTAETETNSTIFYSSSDVSVIVVDAVTGVITFSGAGTAVVSATASETEDFAETSITYTITVLPRPVTLEWIDCEQLVYDGYPKNVSALVLNAIGSDTVPITVDGGDSINAGTYTAQAVAVENKNYTLNGGNPLTKEYSILKADSFVAEDGILVIANGFEYQYPYALSQLLPQLPEAMELGDFSFSLVSVSLDNDYYSGNLEINKNLMLLPVNEVIREDETELGTINVVIFSDNFESSDATITVFSSNKAVPTGEPVLSTDTLIFGQKLSSISLSGFMMAGDNAVNGLFSWSYADIVPRAGFYEAGWVFNPMEEDSYLSVSNTKTITIHKATPNGIPTIANIMEDGKTLADTMLTGVFKNPVTDLAVAGFLAWDDGEGQPVAANTTYSWTFTPKDTLNYNSVSGSIIPYVRAESLPNNGNSSGGGGGGGGGGPSGPVTPVTMTPPVENNLDKSTGIFNKSSGNKDNRDLSVTLTPGSGTLTQVKNGNTVLKEGVDYMVDGNTYTLTKAYLETLKNGLHTIVFNMSTGKDPEIKVTVRGSMPRNRSPVELEFKTDDVVFPFRDIPSTAWYRQDVEAAYQSGLINGKTADTFEPEANITFAEVIKLAACMHQLYHDGEVSLEVGAVDWYSTYMEYALEKGIITEDLTDNADTVASREEFVNIFYGAIPESNYIIINDVVDDAIPDVKLANRFAARIYAFYRAGILVGSDTQGTFNPYSAIQRSEVAAIMTRLFTASARRSITLK